MFTGRMRNGKPVVLEEGAAKRAAKRPAKRAVWPWPKNRKKEDVHD